MPISERKKFIQLLESKLLLERSEAEGSTDQLEVVKTQLEVVKTQIDAVMPQLLALFKCSTQDEFHTMFPTTQDVLAAVRNQRYFVPRKTPTHRSSAVYDELRLHGTDKEYLQFLRVTKEFYTSIVASVLSQNKIFHNHSNNSQETIEKQFAITLWRMGHHGISSGIGEASKIFGVSEGSILKCTQRCLVALRDMSTDIITWPSLFGKTMTKSRIKSIACQGNSHEKSGVGISDAIGIMSCMNVFLCSRPSIKDADTYVIASATASRPRSNEEPTPLMSAQETGAATNEDGEERSLEISQKGKRRKKSQKTKQPDIAPNPSDSTSSTKVNEFSIDALENTVPPLDTTWESSVPTLDGTVSTPAESSSSVAAAASTTTQESSRRKKRTVATSQNNPVSSAPPANSPKPSAYIKKNYGFRVLIVCDPTTRIRFLSVLKPGATLDQDVYESCELAKNQGAYFEGKDYLIGDHAFVPSSTVVVPFLDSELTSPSSSSSSSSTENEADRERLRFNEAMAMIQKRNEDCQRVLKARFPSLLGLRVQVKDEQDQDQEFATNWIMACICIHNLVLGDDTSFDPVWNNELDAIENGVLLQQEQWRQQVFFPKPRGRRGRKSTSAKNQDQDDALQVQAQLHQLQASAQAPRRPLPPLPPPSPPPPPEQVYAAMSNPPVGLAVLSEIAEGIERRDALCAGF
ncbi:hypothetical protein BG004_006276 [Podila humilis]|nr:hypothetical protein BG004_006276 [Podila humilis]